MNVELTIEQAIFLINAARKSARGNEKIAARTTAKLLTEAGLEASMNAQVIYKQGNEYVIR